MGQAQGCEDDKAKGGSGGAQGEPKPKDPRLAENPPQKRHSSSHDLAEKMAGHVAVSGRYHVPPKRMEDDYKVDPKVLGSGFNGSVFLAYRKDSKNQKEKYAVKEFKLRGLSADKRKELQGECEIFLSMDHPHVARLVDVYDDEQDRIVLLMECMEGGELFDRVIARKRFAEKDAAIAAHQMLLAINYLHSHGIVHRDIKLENWLYESEHSDHLKLIDFGFSKVQEVEEGQKVKMHMSCGTLSYVAPEVLQKSYTSQCDMWSMGVVVFILLAGYMPFSGPDEKQVKCIKEGKFTFKEEKWSSVSKTGRDFVENLMKVDAKARLTAEQALQHKWIVDSPELENTCDESTIRNLVSFSQESKFRRQCMLAMAWSLSNEERAKLRNAFMAMDKNNCGTITIQEFKQCVEEYYHLPDDQLQQVFESIDTAHNGEIQYTEFLAAMVSSRIHLYDDFLKTAFKRFDTDSSGYISLDNLKDVLGENFSEKEIQNMMNEVDDNHDGKISFQEFKDYVHGDNNNVMLLDQFIDSGVSNHSGEQAGLHDKEHVMGKQSSMQPKKEVSGGCSVIALTRKQRVNGWMHKHPTSMPC